MVSLAPLVAAARLLCRRLGRTLLLAAGGVLAVPLLAAPPATSAGASSRKRAPSPTAEIGQVWLELLTAQIPAILWSVDRDLRLIHMFGGGTSRLNRAPEDYVGLSLFDAFQTDDPDFPPIAVHRQALEGQAGAYEYASEGRQYDVRVEPLRDEAGRIVGCVALALDITERKQVEETLHSIQDELEERVTARTFELLELNQRLQQEVGEHKRTEAQLRQSEYRYRGMIESQQELVVRVDPQGCFTFVNEAYCRKFGKTPEELLGTSFQPLVHPEDLPATLAAMEDLNIPPYRISVEQRARTVEGWRWIAWEDFALRNEAGEIVEIQATGRDITERILTEQAEREQRALAEALRDTAAALNSTLNLDEVLDRILANVGRVVPHDAANIMLVESGVALVARARGYERHVSPGVVEAIRCSIAEIKGFKYMAEKGQPIIIEDVHDYPAWINLQGRRWVRSYVGAPITIEGELIGFLNLDSALPGIFTAEHTERLQAFANQAAIAIRNARLHKQAQELAAIEAALDERARIARDLHDNVSQTLFSASVIAQSLSHLVEDKPDEVKGGLEELRQATHGALAEMRALLLELRPSDLNNVKLDSLLGQLVDAFAGKTQVPVALKVRGRCLLPPDTRMALYRIAQEALNNILKHAHASRVEIDLHSQPGHLELRIADDGCGFDPLSVPAERLGLKIMRERAIVAGVNLTITSAPGAGTTLLAKWEQTGGRD